MLKQGGLERLSPPSNTLTYHEEMLVGTGWHIVSYLMLDVAYFRFGFCLSAKIMFSSWLY